MRWFTLLLSIGCEGGATMLPIDRADGGSNDADVPVVVEIPILSRPLEGDHRCTPELVANLDPLRWGPLAIATTTAGAFLARYETLVPPAGAQPSYSEVRLSRIDAGSISDPIATID